MDNTVYFGYYRMSAAAFEREQERGYINVFIDSINPSDPAQTAEILKTAGKRGCKVWLGVFGVVVAAHAPIRFFDDWRERLNRIMAYLEAEAGLDSLLGFYLDEPFLCGFSKQDYLSLTRYLMQTWPQKRMLVVFAVNAVEPKVWSSGNDCVLDPETAAYTTDAGFDMYWDVRDGGIAGYETVAAALKERFCREDFRVWYVPSIMNYCGNKDEAYAIAHTEAMYAFLKREKHPGGMLCYAYDIPNHDGDIGNIGFREMRDEPTHPWRTLEQRLLEIGREIIKA